MIRDKTALLAEFHPLPAGLVGRLTIDKFQVELPGDLAIASHEDQEFLDYFGQALQQRQRITDTWIRTPDGWRLMAEQILALQVDPPATVLPRRLMCFYMAPIDRDRPSQKRATCSGDELLFKRSDRPVKLYKAEVSDVFFAPRVPRTRRVVQRNEGGETTGFVGWREVHEIRRERL